MNLCGCFFFKCPHSAHLQNRLSVLVSNLQYFFLPVYNHVFFITDVKSVHYYSFCLISCSEYLSFQHALCYFDRAAVAALIFTNLTNVSESLCTACLSLSGINCFCCAVSFPIAFISPPQMATVIFSPCIQINTSPAADVFNTIALSRGSVFVLLLGRGCASFLFPSLITSVLLYFYAHNFCPGPQ